MLGFEDQSIWKEEIIPRRIIFRIIKCVNSPVLGRIAKHRNCPRRGIITGPQNSGFIMLELIVDKRNSDMGKTMDYASLGFCFTCKSP